MPTCTIRSLQLNLLLFGTSLIGATIMSFIGWLLSYLCKKHTRDFNLENYLNQAITFEFQVWTGVFELEMAVREGRGDGGEEQIELQNELRVSVGWERLLNAYTQFFVLFGFMEIET